MDHDEEYEIIPTSPIRRLEKRISKVETTSSSSEIRRLIEQIVELIKSNQRIIDDVIKSDAELRNEVGKIPGKIDDLLTTMHEFLDIIKASASEEGGPSSDVFEPLIKKMDDLIEHTKKSQETNQAALSSLETIDKRLKRSMQTQASYRR
jgi:methyl-accepting chemotaxis protein